MPPFYFPADPPGLQLYALAAEAALGASMHTVPSHQTITVPIAYSPPLKRSPLISP